MREFTFKHAVVQKVAYDNLVHADRKLLHSRLIDTLETTFPHLIDDHVEKLSEHAISAERWDKAEKYLLRSAGRALQRSSHNLALSFLQKGLEILAKRPKSAERDRREVGSKLIGVAWMAAKGRGAEEVLAAYERAEVLCGELADEVERFIALRGRAQYYMISGQPRAAQTISLRCADLTKHLQNTGIAIETHHDASAGNFFMGVRSRGKACGRSHRTLRSRPSSCADLPIFRSRSRRLQSVLCWLGGMASGSTRSC